MGIIYFPDREKSLIKRAQRVSGTFYDTTIGTKSINITLSNAVDGYADGYYAIDITQSYSWNSSTLTHMELTGVSLTSSTNLQLTGYYPEAYRWYTWRATVYDLNKYAIKTIERGFTSCLGNVTISLTNTFTIQKCILIASLIDVPHANTSGQIDGGMLKYLLSASTSLNAYGIGSTYGYKLLWTIIEVK